jgi:hypothetical protein
VEFNDCSATCAPVFVLMLLSDIMASLEGAALTLIGATQKPGQVRRRTTYFYPIDL